MSKCRWFWNGGWFDSETHLYVNGVCALCDKKEPNYKPSIRNCSYCGTSIINGGICGSCQEALNREKTLIGERRLA